MQQEQEVSELFASWPRAFVLRVPAREIFLSSRRVAQFLAMSSQLLFQGLLIVGIAQTISSAGLGNSPESCDSDGSSYLQKARQQGVLNFMVHQGMNQRSIANIVYRYPYAFATLDNHDPSNSDSSALGCQTNLLSVPSGDCPRRH